MTCNNCGTELKEDIAFCTNCGTRIESEPATAETQPPPDQPQYRPPGYPPPYPPPDETQRERKTDRTIGIVFGVVLPIVAIFVIAAIVFGVSSLIEFLRDSNNGMDETQPGVVGPVTPGSDSGILATPIPLPPTPRPPADVETLPELLPPPPPATPSAQVISGNELIGEWKFHSGDFVYFFALSEYIEFFENEDGTLSVFESDYGEWGTVYIEVDGHIVIEGELTGRNTFVFTLNGDNLTITDIDGDTIHYTRVR